MEKRDSLNAYDGSNEQMKSLHIYVYVSELVSMVQ